MKPTFSIEEAFKAGWQKIKAHSGILFQTMLILFALEVAQAVVSAVLVHQFIGALASLAIVVAEVVVGIGFTLVTLKLAKNQHTGYNDLIPPAKLVWQYILASLLTGIIIVAGFILFIIPGVYFALRFSMVRFAVLEGAGVRGSLTQSAHMTHGVKWKLLGFLLLCGLINIVGMLLLMVGLLVTVPLTMVAYAHVYTKLHAHHQAHHTHHAHAA